VYAPDVALPARSAGPEAMTHRRATRLSTLHSGDATLALHRRRNTSRSEHSSLHTTQTNTAYDGSHHEHLELWIPVFELRPQVQRRKVPVNSRPWDARAVRGGATRGVCSCTPALHTAGPIAYDASSQYSWCHSLAYDSTVCSCATPLLGLCDANRANVGSRT
jgi:hypothetical protein